MKGIKLILLLNLINIASYGQAYLEYYQLCNQADKELYLKKWDAALKSFEAAFKLVDYVHAAQYEKASRGAAQIGDYEKAYYFAKRSILNSNEKAFWKDKQFEKFRQSKFYGVLLDSLVNFRNQSHTSINLDYKNKIDSLYFLDQTIFRKNNSVKGDFKIDRSQLPKNGDSLDSMNLVTLLKLINVYGFPSEQLIGISAYEKATIIIHHNFRLEQNDKYHTIAIEAVENGEYLPKDFAGMYEQYNMWYKDQTFFTTFDKNLSEDNLKRINANRLKYGLKDLSAFNIKRKGLSMIPKW